MSFDLSDCRCVACGAEHLIQEAEFAPDRIVRAAVACPACGTTYDANWGAPFLGAFQAEDVIGLVEIASNAGWTSPPPSRTYIRSLNQAIAAYHQANDKEALVRSSTNGFYDASWFPYRYSEWQELNSLVEGMDLSGAKVLDVGAGAGIDGVRLADAGAQVTAIEYHAGSITHGIELVPEARWIGGQSHFMPFKSASFDVVACNAALHHMRDVPATLREMLRVLKPGGWLLTTGDPFCPVGCRDDVEFQVFNAHTAVLGGVNESIVDISDLIDPLLDAGDRIRPRALIANLNGEIPEIAQHREGPIWIDGADFDDLRRAGGSIALKVKVERAATEPAPIMDRPILAAGEYAALLRNEPAAMTRLAELLPNRYLDRPFPGERQTKFELLNGWQAPVADAPHRRAYSRARWFLTRPLQSQLGFDVRRSADAGSEHAKLSVAINGQVVSTAPIGGAWSTVYAPIGVAEGAAFVCELRLELEPGAEPGFEDLVFEVKNRRFVGST